MIKQTSKFTIGGLILISVIIVTILVSIIINVATDNWIDSYQKSLAVNNSFRVLSMVKPSPLPGTYEESLDIILKAGTESVALLQKKTRDSSRQQDWISQDDSLAVGVVVTADGWMLFDQEVLPNEASLIIDYEIWIAGKRYEISSIQLDTLTKLAMVKVEADNLSAVEFGASDEINVGSILFALSDSDGVIAVSLSDIVNSTSSLVQPAEIFTDSWFVDEALEPALPLFSSSGTFVGFTDIDGAAIPLHLGSRFVSSIIRGDENNHTGLGAYVVDVDSVLNMSEEETYGYAMGALIYSPNSYTPAVVRSGPADLAELKAGDLILSVNGVSILGSVSLADLLAKHASGDTVTFQIANEDGISDVKVVLSNYEDLY